MWSFKYKRTKRIRGEIADVKVVAVDFGMQVSYKVLSGRGKGKIINTFYKTFSGMDEFIRKELVKIVFTGGKGP